LKPEKILVKEEFHVPVQIKIEPFTRKESVSKRNASKKDFQSNKNIIKNYARAMVNFALSSLSMPYLSKLLLREDVNLKDFKHFMQGQKEEINSIKNLRELLLIKDDESVKISAYKSIFKDLCVTFVKFFAVNWIYNSKVCDKLTHLKYRYKILRRIRNPEFFTYLENFNKTK